MSRGARALYRLLEARPAGQYVCRSRLIGTRGARLTTVMIFHEVDDVDHWLRSPKREEFFGPLGMTVRTFVDPDKTNRVGLIVTVPDLDTLRTALATQAAADAMKFDGVRSETIVMLIES